MPHRARWSSSVRLSELDLDGRAHSARILEWFQEAAAYASTQLGFPPDRYTELGAAWFIREFIMTLEAPPAYAEPFAVETWVSDLRRFRTRREYVARAGGRIFARGQADWLYLERDPATGKVRPRHVTTEIKDAFRIEDEHALASETVIPWREVGLGAIDRQRRHVRPTDIDAQGHANNTVYLRWLEDHALSLHPQTRLTAVRIEYLADAKVGEEIELCLEHHPDGYTQWIERDGQRLVRAEARRG